MVSRSLSPFGSAYGSDPFFSLQREMNRLFDDTMRGSGRAPPRGQSQTGVPLDARMNVSETEREIRITAELPGVNEDDVEVTLEGDVLTISGEKRFEQERGGEKETYHFIERSYGSFQRSVQLPYPIKPEDVRAHFYNGVLTLSLPKGEQQTRRKIPIGASSGRREEGAGERDEKSVGNRKSGAGG